MGLSEIYKNEIDQAFIDQELVSCVGTNDTPLTAMLSGLRSNRTGVEVALKLIKAGANITETSKDYDLAPLDYALGAAIRFSNESTVDDAFINWGDQYVIKRELRKIIPLLVEKGADTERVSKYGVSTIERFNEAERLLETSLKP